MKEKTIGSDLMDVNETDEDEFGFSRNYFLAKDLRACGKKSTKKLSDLALFDEQELREEASKIEQKHGKETASLLNNYKSLYPEWVFELRCGFGLLFYGFGSKKALIEDFASTTLSDSGVVVINGYLQSINLKHASAFDLNSSSVLFSVYARSLWARYLVLEPPNEFKSLSSIPLQLLRMVNMLHEE